MVQPISAGVACWAAKMMSPSFSRSSLSTTRTGRPAAMARMASSIGSSPECGGELPRRGTGPGVGSLCRSPPRALLPRLLPLEKASRRSVYFASTSTSRLTRPPMAFAPRPVSASVVGISPTSNHGAGSGGRADGGHGEGDAVDGDGALFGDVPGQSGRHAEAEPVPVAQRLALQQLADAVDVALDDVAVQPAAGRDAAFQVDRVAGGEFADGAADQGLAHDVDAEVLAVDLAWR